MINTMFQTSMGDFYFDAVFKTEHHANMKITEHPVQTGASISDHAYVEPDEITVDIGMTDVNGDGRSAGMYSRLKRLMLTREPFNAVTRMESYPNMLIASMSVPDDYTTMFALKASLVLKQVRVVSVAVVQVQQTVSGSKEPSAPAPASSASSAAKQTQQAAQTAQTGEENKASILKSLAQTAVNEKAVQSAKAKAADTVKTTKAATPVSVATAAASTSAKAAAASVSIGSSSVADKILKATKGHAMVALK